MLSMFEKIESPEEIRGFDIDDLYQIAEFLREKIIKTISHTGGHLASSLGTVEMTVALHAVFNTPQDKIVWDVGHQCYAHKLLTGRMKNFDTIRQYEGLSGFTKRSESVYDPFGAGHSSTSISSALGFAAARDQLKEDYEVIAVIGDGAMTGGMAFEGLNNAGHLKTNITVILNDNEMSISKNVGALTRHLSRLRMEPHYVKVREDLRRLVKQIPRFGKSMLKTAESIEDKLTYLLVPGVLFEALGFTYLGPFDGHDIEQMMKVFTQVKDIKGPRLIHLVTQKGKGYKPAEQDATKWHGAIPFDIETGNGLAGPSDKKIPSYSDVFCDTLVKLARKDSRIVAISAAMPDGTGLAPFCKEFPHRFYDVGIAEQHAITFAAGLAAGGMRPVAAIYSTFMQRAFDQIIHDVCLQKLPVVMILDRGGLVGEDGPTHHGVFDLSFLRLIPDLIIMAPKDEDELQHMVKSAFDYESPVVIRFPRGKGVGIPMSSESQLEKLPLGRGEIMREGKDLCLMAVGSMVYPAILAAEQIQSYGFNPYVVNMRFVKPMDKDLVLEMAQKTRNIVTIEENTSCGGFGSAVLEVIHESDIENCRVQNIGVPDVFIEHGNMTLLREKYGLTAEGIVRQIRMANQVAGR